MIPLIFDYINFTTLGTKMATGPVVGNYVQRFGKNSTKETDKTSNEIHTVELGDKELFGQPKIVP